MSHIGFTGSRHGMTRDQMTRVEKVLASRDLFGMCLHHGDCVGADAEFHKMGRANSLYMIGHPPTNDRRRAFCDFDETREPLPYLIRNKAIVHECGLLIAAPAEDSKGTWHAVRYAERTGTPVVIVWPDGSVSGNP